VQLAHDVEPIEIDVAQLALAHRRELASLAQAIAPECETAKRAPPPAGAARPAFRHRGAETRHDGAPQSTR